MNILWYNIVQDKIPEDLYKIFKESIIKNGYTGKFLTIGDRKTDADWCFIATDEQKIRYRLKNTQYTSARSLLFYFAPEIIKQPWDWIIYSDVDVVCHENINKWIEELDKTKDVLITSAIGNYPPIFLLQEHEKGIKFKEDQKNNHHPRSICFAVRGDKAVEFFTAYAMSISNGDYTYDTGLIVALTRGNFNYGYLNGVSEFKQDILTHYPNSAKMEMQKQPIKKKCCR